PESTGKTAMAEALAQALGTLWVPEFARYYTGHLGRPYEHNDLKTIGLGQKAWEEWYAGQLNRSSNPNVLICDTDWTVLQIWEQYRFKVNDNYHWQQGYGAAENADLYFLCAPDFSWQPDPLREHPEERHTLFELYESLLRTCRANFITLSGTHETRLQTALPAIRKFL
ncbi:MAG TPA: ATP-binding protein, partial [Saprospiraceae bacterium]|nr:ATP-binding protein [Saprospiraceae bacterium]